MVRKNAIVVGKGDSRGERKGTQLGPPSFRGRPFDRKGDGVIVSRRVNGGLATITTVNDLVRHAAGSRSGSSWHPIVLNYK